MRTTTITVGLVFGALLATVLLAPLYVALPARYVDNWFYLAPGWTLGGLAAALLLAGLAGFCAGLVDDEAAIRNGTVAGLVASLIAGGLVVLPASAIEACGSLLAMAAYETITAERLTEATAGALVAGVWIPPAIGLAVAGGGAALGAMGGVVYDLWRGSSSARAGRLVRRSLVPFVGLLAVGLGALASAIWVAHIDLTALPKLGLPADLSVRMELALPQLVAGVAASWFVAWGMRDVVITWRDDQRMAAIVWMGSVLLLPLVTLATVAALHLPSLATPAPWIAVVSVCLAALSSLVAAGRSDHVREPRPRTTGEVFGEILFAAVVFVTIPLFISGSSIVGTYLIAFPYARALAHGAPLVDAPPGVVVNQTFAWHWASLPLGIVIFFVFTAAVTPLWVFGRALRR